MSPPHGKMRQHSRRERTPVATTPGRPKPGDLNSLIIDQLAPAEQWFTIAAIAKASPAHLGRAMELLAPACGDAEPFAWLWSLYAEQELPTPDVAWGSFAQLPARVAVSRNLQSPVVEFISAPANATCPGEYNARIDLLERLPEELRVRAARAVLTATSAADVEAHPPKVVANAAVAYLAREGNSSARSLVRSTVRDWAPQERLATYAMLTAPLTPTELGDIISAATDLLENQTTPDADAVLAIQDTWSELPLATQRSLAAGPLTTQPGLRRRIFDPDFAQRIGVVEVIAATSPGSTAEPNSGMAPGTFTALVADLVASLPSEQAGDLLVAAHDHVEADVLNDAYAQALARLAALGAGDETRAPLLAALSTCAVTRGAHASIPAIAVTLNAHEARPAVAGIDIADPQAQRHLGSLLGAYLQSSGRARDEADQSECGTDVLAVLDDIADDDARTTIVTEMVGELATLPPLICSYVELVPSLTAAVIAGNQADSLIVWLENRDINSNTSPGVSPFPIWSS
jgi:hypothetical protein